MSELLRTGRVVAIDKIDLKEINGACAVFCAVGGVEPQSETVWRQAAKYWTRNQYLEL